MLSPQLIVLVCGFLLNFIFLFVRRRRKGSNIPVLLNVDVLHFFSVVHYSFTLSYLHMLSLKTLSCVYISGVFCPDRQVNIPLFLEGFLFYCECVCFCVCTCVFARLRVCVSKRTLFLCVFLHPLYQLQKCRSPLPSPPFSAKCRMYAFFVRNIL